MHIKTLKYKVVHICKLFQSYMQSNASIIIEEIQFQKHVYNQNNIRRLGTCVCVSFILSGVPTMIAAC